MKRFRLLLVLLYAMAGCNAVEETFEPVQEESISLTTSYAELDCSACSIELTVASSASWWIDGVYEWIRPSVTEGVDSDKIVFEVSGNTSGSVRSAVISFWCGWTKTLFTIVQQPEPYVPEGSGRLTGDIIGSTYSVDYMGGSVRSQTVNNKDKAFDGDMYSFFASYDTYQSWIGLDLGQKHVITKVGWSPRMNFQDLVELALFEGANNPDFSDALPLHIVKEPGENGVMHYADVSCSRGFRYVRYISTNSTRCVLSELEFYGFRSDGDDSRLYQLTDLPTVVIHTPGHEEITSKEYELSSNVYIISNDGKDLLSTSGTGVRGRGNSTWSFPKKPYRLKFESKHSPLGAPASAKKWTLLSNYGDKSLLRNITAFEVSRRVGLSYTPFCRPVDLIVNSEYRGCYQFCDQVEAASGRVEAKDGYLIEIDAYAYDEDVWFQSEKGTPVTIKHPDEDDITAQEQDFIRSYFTMMENSVFSDNYTDALYGYRKYLDLDSFLRNFIVGEFCGNVDAFWSVYMYKDYTDGKLFTGPTWDHDLSLDNDYRLYPTNALTDFVYISKGSVASQAVRDMVTRIVKQDPQARARLIEIWDDVRGEDGLAGLSEMIDQTAAQLRQSQELNFKRWKILDKIVHMNFQALVSYDAEVETVKTYVTQRVETLDRLIKNL